MLKTTLDAETIIRQLGINTELFEQWRLENKVLQTQSSLEQKKKCHQFKVLLESSYCHLA
ncbi:MAG: hypothetical protein K0Q73_6314 [Paenibacillus sp.]|jgi:AmiR/NasT family two-component response regulator|nr:hypothetical protein [Paenibacillus sp.]